MIYIYEKSESDGELIVLLLVRVDMTRLILWNGEGLVSIYDNYKMLDTPSLLQKYPPKRWLKGKRRDSVLPSRFGF
jgi:hypothetical protein